jgi:hypothetical protein
VDAVVPVDAQNASTSDFENCTDRSFQQASTPVLFLWKNKEKKKKNEEERSTYPLNRILARDRYAALVSRSKGGARLSAGCYDTFQTRSGEETTQGGKVLKN